MIALAKSEAWHEERLRGIGSSDAGTVVGLGLTTPYELWEEKLGLREREDLSENNAVKWGIILEDTVANVVAMEHPEWVIRRKNATVWSTAWPFAYAHLDRTVNDGEQPGTPLEIKTAAYENEWGASGTQEIPSYYLPQIQHQLACSGKAYAYVAAFILSIRELRIYRIERNDAYIDTLMRAEEAFWTNVLDRVAPDPVNAADVIAQFPKAAGSVEAPDDVLLAAARYLEVNALLKSLEEEKAALRDTLAVAHGANEMLTANGRKLATFKPQDYTRFDAKRLEADHPDIYERYLNKGTSRTLRVG